MSIPPSPLTVFTDLRETRFAVRRNPTIYVRAHLGRNKPWVKISRLEALELLNTIDEFATPEQAGIEGGAFARQYENGLYLGHTEVTIS